MTPVGLEDGRIKDNQITASSHWDNHEASGARLNNKYKYVNNKISWGAWCTDVKDTHQYLSVDLGHVRAISGVATQGAILKSFVKNYKMNYSLDGQEWKMFVQNGAAKVTIRTTVMMTMLADGNDDGDDGGDDDDDDDGGDDDS